MNGKGTIGGAAVGYAENQARAASLYGSDAKGQQDTPPNGEINNEVARLQKAVQELHGTVSILVDRLHLVIIPEEALRGSISGEPANPIGSPLGAQLRESSHGVMYDSARLQDLMRQLAI